MGKSRESTPCFRCLLVRATSFLVQAQRSLSGLDLVEAGGALGRCFPLCGGERNCREERRNTAYCSCVENTAHWGDRGLCVRPIFLRYSCWAGGVLCGLLQAGSWGQSSDRMSKRLPELRETFAEKKNEPSSGK